MCRRRKTTRTNGLAYPTFRRKKPRNPILYDERNACAGENGNREPRRKNAGAADRPAAARPGKETMKMFLLLPLQAILAAKSVRREDGQALVEYALLLFLIAVVSIAILSVLGQSVSSVFSEINADF